MKKSFRRRSSRSHGLALFFVVVFFWQSSPALADTVYFKDGRVWNGLVKKESATHVDLDLGFDTARLEKKKIHHILRSSAKERLDLQYFLSEEKTRKDKILKARDAKPSPIRYQNKDGHVYVDAWVDGKRLHLLLDTGASVVTLTVPAARRLGIRPEESRLIVPLGVADGRKSRGALVVLKSVKLGAYEVKNVSAVILLDQRPNTSTGDGLLGMSFLKYFNFKIDAKRHELILEKNP